MGEFTITKWRCDRCRIVADKYERPSSAYSIRASVDYGTCGGSVIQWEQLCLNCNRAVEKQIDDIVASGVRAADAHATPTIPNADGEG
jgi:hypothetical protein